MNRDRVNAATNTVAFKCLYVVFFCVNSAKISINDSPRSGDS